MEPASTLSATSTSTNRLRLARVLTVVSVLFGCLPFLARWWWIADLAANLRVQLLMALTVTVTLVAFVSGRRHASVVGIVLLLNAFAMAPAFIGAEPNAASRTSASADSASRLRVCSNNVYISNSDFDRIIASVDEAEADVLAIVELSHSLVDRLQQHLGETHPHFVSGINDDGTFGIGLWSKYPVAHSEVFYLCEPLVPSIEADIDVNGTLVRVIATHPIPPVNSRAFAARNLHLEMLADRVHVFRRQNAYSPVILLGDLNLTPWSPHFDRFLVRSGLESSASGRGLQPTWYRWRTFLFGLVLDHGLYTSDLECIDRRILGDTGSDHRPVVIDFRL